MSFRRSFITIFFAVLSMSLFGQKKIIVQARDYIKGGNNLDKAEMLMTDLLKDSANMTNMKIWNTLFEAIKAQYEQGNEKLYLKQQYDTASLFSATKRMFTVLEAMDSVDAMPDRKGKIRLKYREKNSSYLNAYRPNLYNGGVFFINKKAFAQAYDFFHIYIDCAKQPLFSSFNYLKNDKMIPIAAYWASYCGYKLHDPDKALKYMYIAGRDTSKTKYLLQFKSEMLKLNEDTIGYVRTLKEGFAKYPTFPFFFPRLVEYYTQHEMLDSAMIMTNRALAKDSDNVVYRFTKSTILLNTGKYEECIDICKDLIAKNDTLADVFYNIGLAYFNMAIELDKVSQKHSRVKKKIIDNYSKSRPYMERYRQLMPDRADKWATVLYTIYLNLNMGKEFDEIDKLIKRKQL